MSTDPKTAATSSSSSDHSPASLEQSAEQSASQEEREYEKSGLYPDNGKPFRLYALLGWLFGIVVFMAAAAAILDTILLE